MFRLGDVFKGVKDYNPGSKRAEQLAEQFRRYH